MLHVRTKAFLTIVAVIIGTVLLSAGTGSLFIRALERDAMRDLQAAQDAAGKLVSSRLDRLKEEAIRVVWHLSAQNSKVTDAALKREAEHHDYLAITLFDDAFDILASHGAPPGNTAARNIYLERARNGKTALSTTERVDGQTVIRIYTPMGKGILAVTLPGRVLGEILSGFQVSRAERFFILEPEGNLIGEGFLPARRGGDDPGKIETTRRMSRGETGIGSYVEAGEHYLCAFGPVFGSEGWSLGVALPVAKTAFAQSRFVLWIAEGVFFLLGCGVALLASERVVRSSRRIAEQEEAFRALEKVVADAPEARRSFLANISHEMRAPLNAIIGLSELSLEGGKLPQELKGNLEGIHQSGITLLRIINDILDISRIESGRTELIPVEYDLPDLIHETVRENVPLIAEKPVRFLLKVDETLPVKLLGDAPRVKEVFANLLSNAFKYTREGTVAWYLSWERRDNEVWLISTIEDTGIGIRKNALDKIFANYDRNDRNIEGTGLGLAITKRLVDMMGGEISATSEQGKGSTFSVRLRQGFLTETPIGHEGAARLEGFDAPGAGQADGEHVQIPEARVLVVDDVADDLDVLRGFLEAYGMQVDCAASGQEAIARIRAATVNYNAIFMDHMMPGMDGIETTRVIREEIGTDYARMVPIIALTANALAGYEKIFSSQGFQEYLTKPVDSGQVDTVIRHWVRNRTWTPGKPRKTGHRIAGIDWNKGLARFGGDEERYRAALESYVANTAHFLDKIRDVHAEMLSEYSAIVHDIKENSYAIEAHLIGEQAETLEHAARDGKFDFVSQGNPTFILLLENLLADITVDVADTLSDAPDPLA